MLGEECWQAAKERKETDPFCRVAWVHDHIMIMEKIGEYLQIRSCVVFPCEQMETVDAFISAAAMRESGHYHFSTRQLAGFLLAEVSVYVLFANTAEELCKEFTEMNRKLDETLGGG